MKILTTATTGSPEWLAARKGKIGASQVAQCLGFDPVRSPLEAWMDITGRNEEKDTGPMWAGRTFEKACAEAWLDRERDSGRALVLGLSPGLLQHERHQWLIGTPDFLYYFPNAATGGKDSASGVLECKWLNAWAEGDWIDQPPLKDQTQLQLYLELTGFDEGALAVVFGGQKLQSVRLVKDEIYLMQLLESLEEWYERYVVRDTPPPPRGPDVGAYTRLLGDSSSASIELDDGELPLAEELEVVRETKKVAEKREEEIKAFFLTRLGTAGEGVFSNGVRITAKTTPRSIPAKEAYVQESRPLRVTRRFQR